jgi:hypothetical protein
MFVNTIQYSFYSIHLVIAVICLFLDPIRTGANAQSHNPPEVVDPFGAKNRTAAGPTRWSRIVKGHTGVAAMQITVVSDKYALILDKASSCLLCLSRRRALVFHFTNILIDFLANRSNIILSRSMAIELGQRSTTLRPMGSRPWT